MSSTTAAVTAQTTFPLLDREWDLLPGVFAPTHCASTGFFTESIPFPVGGSFLEVGCGTGVTAVEAALRGCARVAATDISAAAVENTRLNTDRHAVSDRVEVYRGDVFDGLPPQGRFDVVFWNSPFVDPGIDERSAARPVEDDRRKHLRRAVFDPGYRAHERYLLQAGARLTAAGRLLLGFSDLGDHDALARLAADAGYRISVLRTSGDLVSGVDYQLLELLPR
ncbi:methyltransferase [Cellulomonas xiejunii]|uniref:Class I SAM-dependent methyltransferase n=1 Tax=Cellulomonas xiejunii TaxID=2968083 RepID=A0ABY5KRJ7_9CELL|nr:methyltransferase [Cellulomonas xiejunii]MCC2321225.1 class I SAM-dependent methyltransferase [Cellulomonas xiejunii]UUI71812.1 class I SAM-dependent methyltransferase [Cellulomonas xiejunii]